MAILPLSAATEDPRDRLQKILAGYKNAVLAFSGGVDSALLLDAAAKTMGRNNVLAVTVESAINPPGEVEEARRLAKSAGVEHMVVAMNPMLDEAFVSNPPLRCYHCKRKIMGLMLDIARDRGVEHLLDGANADDTGDYRPGMRAAREMGVKSPLLEAGLTKQDIRALSRRLGLPTADKPSAACLASRFPYGTRITARALEMVAAAEVFLARKGFAQVRVRYHGHLARIEVPTEEVPALLVDSDAISGRLKKLGFIYVTIDLQGYRTGSMNETIPDAKVNNESR
ncbi:MAG: ATP-dependent sacrificial sulfur transferase LarE [Firmicutes bacterium]|nr:ATP-dependent sacrificial sulfur transferase LarE [Bacillota bacterium]